MPTYQYACPDCGYKFELKQKFTDDAIKKCPRCERRHVYRVVGPVGISFKGSLIVRARSRPSGLKKLVALPSEGVVLAIVSRRPLQGRQPTETMDG